MFDRFEPRAWGIPWDKWTHRYFESSGEAKRNPTPGPRLLRVPYGDRG